MRISIVINESDRGILDRIRGWIHLCREKGHEVAPRLTFEAGDATRMAGEACDAGCDLVIAAGGDGTVNEVVNGMHARAQAERTMAELPRLAIVPLGTGNDLAATLGIPNEVEQALEIALAGRDVPLDIGLVEGRCFVNVSTGGFGAEATEDASDEAKRVLGPLAYLITGVQKFVGLNPLEARVSSGGQTIAEGPFLLFAVGNGQRTGGGNLLTPRADTGDGLLDLCLVGEMSRIEFVRLLPQLRSGDHLDHPAVLYRQHPEFTIESGEELSVNADGEPMSGRRFHYSVSPVRIVARCGVLPA